MVTLKPPYLILVGDTADPVDAKTAFGLADWCREKCIGQLRFTQDAVDVGLPNIDVAEAVLRGAQTLIVGTAPVGGQLPASFDAAILAALAAGMDVASGLHIQLNDIPAFVECARAHGRTIHDVRHNKAVFGVGSGLPRSGKRLLTVGTDCALGKKYTALSLAREMAARGMKVDFRATGQTGILISGSGVAIDSVVADFIAGAAESLSPDNDEDHWDVIEGQGALNHPAYAGVTLGLIHGSQPDALVLCHDPSRRAIRAFEHIAIPPLEDVMQIYLQAARLTNPQARFVGCRAERLSRSR
jgi:uncharacterized NAD-dependent epimerase/dehydratase family protein